MKLGLAMKRRNPGLSFELSAMEMITRALRTGRLGIDPSCAQVYHHKAYYSREREGEVVVDVSLEVTRRGAASPCLVWVWECKHYTHSVSVDDVEEFHAKLQQIGGDRTKGTVVTTVGFQKASVAYAKTHGIGLVRVLGVHKWTFDLENTAPLASEELCAYLMDGKMPHLVGDAIAMAGDGAMIVGSGTYLSYQIRQSIMA